MKKFLLNVLGAIILCCTLTGCCINHEWLDATCTAPKTCNKCQETEGDALGHTWEEATCTSAKKCGVCGETEGDALGHTWKEATCTEPKKCNACGTTEGDALGHTLTDANYQQASYCEICNETVGEPLQAEYVMWGIDVNAAKLDTIYDFETTCYGNTDKTTTMKVSFTNYKTFTSDDTHAAKEGYEWKSVDINVAGGDDNCCDQGYDLEMYYDDFYHWLSENNDLDWGTFAIDYNGKIYTDCKFIEHGESDEWDEEKNLEMREQYGWKHIIKATFTISALVPEGYDGFVYGLYNPKSNFEDVSMKEATPRDYIYFRFE